jgi:hypothetical protein
MDLLLAVSHLNKNDFVRGRFEGGELLKSIFFHRFDKQSSFPYSVSRRKRGQYRRGAGDDNDMIFIKKARRSTQFLDIYSVSLNLAFGFYLQHDS